MKRRTYCRFVSLGAASGLGGCLANATPKTDEVPSESTFTVCGPAADRTCEEAGVDAELTADADGYAASDDENEAVSVDFTGASKLTVSGRTAGIGDPTCRTTNLTELSSRGGTLTVVVSNGEEPPPVGGCYESLGINRYRLVVTDLDSAVTAVRVRHTYGDESAFEAAFDRPG
ncbi:hypothetical protein [Halegenticoccus tardaugens]|uniref:hypothetical protein n=1 Tax=Halegenticoccus tardaugens TaxID=2071624 RepID=UPI00100A27A0|nr:hypothetical protein [Halegenticoccus tardaugens]